MSRTYVVFWEHVIGDGVDAAGSTHFMPLGDMEASSAEQACRRLIEKGLPPAPVSELEDGGVTLIAVPARNWTGGRHTLKAETQRRIRSA